MAIKVVAMPSWRLHFRWGGCEWWYHTDRTHNCRGASHEPVRWSWQSGRRKRSGADSRPKHINKNFAEQVARSAERSDASNLDEVIKYVPA